jgi:hypothetical protein
LSLYHYSVKQAVGALASIIGFARQPGNIEPAFFAQFIDNAFSYHYAHVAIFFVAAVLLASVVVAERKWMLVAMLLMGLMFLSFLWHRPANTTAYEVGCALTALSAIAILLFGDDRNNRLLLLALAFGIGYGASGNSSREWVLQLSKTRGVADEGRRILQDVEAAGYPVVVVIPDNNWAIPSPFSSFLKGLSDFPSWQVRADKVSLMGTKVPISFRTVQGGVSPTEPYPADATIVWADGPHLTPLRTSYPALREAIAKRACRTYNLDYPMYMCPPAR